MPLPGKTRNPLTTGVALLLWLAASGVSAWIIFSFLLPQDLSRTTPVYARFVEMSFFGRVLIFHLSLMLLTTCVAALLLKRWRLCVFTVLMALIGLFPDPRSFVQKSQTTVGSNLRIMSMNLKYTHVNAELFVDQVRKYNPDILVLQDYTPFAESTLRQAFDGDYLHRYLQPYTLQGLAIFSRRPFVGGKPVATFTNTRRQLRAVIALDGKPVIIYIEHPYSPRSHQRIISNRLATLDLAQQVAAEKYPVIVAGDFNFTERTPNEQALKEVGLSDAFEIAGHGRGSTWPVEPQWRSWLPGFRIDHVFVSHQLTCTQFFVGDYDGSDHLPIVADVGVWRSR